MVSARTRAAAEAAVVLTRARAALAGDRAALALVEGYLRARQWKRQTPYAWRDPLRRHEALPVLLAARAQIRRDVHRIRRPIERKLMRSCQ